MLRDRVKKLEKNLACVEADHNKIETISGFFFKGNKGDYGKTANGLSDKVGVTRAYVFDFDDPEKIDGFKRF